MSKPTIPEVRARFLDYLSKNPTWGSLRVVLYDGNIWDEHVLWCLYHAKGLGDVEGTELARILRTMSRTQRKKLSRLRP